MSGEPCNSDVRTDEANVNDQGEEAEEGLTTEAKYKDDGDQRVESCCTCNAFHSTPSVGDVDVSVG